MAAVLDRLQSLRVADVMNRHVIPVSGQQTMSEAAAVFVEHRISGAPVVDEHGRCVGILSATDFVGRERERAAGAVGAAGDKVVSAHMNAAARTVSAETSLVEAARIMCAQHVHRLPVLDAQDRPRGMITSLDIVAAVVQAVEEQRGPP